MSKKVTFQAGQGGQRVVCLIDPRPARVDKRKSLMPPLSVLATAPPLHDGDHETHEISPGSRCEVPSQTHAEGWALRFALVERYFPFTRVERTNDTLERVEKRKRKEGGRPYPAIHVRPRESAGTPRRRAEAATHTHTET